MMLESDIFNLGDVCEFYNGKAHEKSIDDQGEFIVVNSKFISTQGNVYKKTAHQIFPLVKEDICFVMSDVPNGKALAKCFIVDQDDLYSLNQRICAIRSNKFNTKFLYYQLNRHPFLLSFNNGENQTNLRKGDILKCPLWCPSTPEQKRIVEILDQAFADIAKARANDEANFKNARELFDSYLQKVFTEKGEGWETPTLGEAVTVERGSSPRPIKNFITDAPDGVNWIKIGDVKEGDKYLTSTNQKITPEGALKSRFVDVGDFILSNSMSFGRPYIMQIPGYIHDGWFVLRLPETLDSEYFYYLLSSPYLKGQFNSLAAGAIVKNISGDLVKKAILPLPPIKKQRDLAKEFSIFSKQVQNLESIYSKKIEALDELKKSLLQKAFSGELTKDEVFA
ncbi:restriction endonuclease subunit S [Lentisphaera marina]|uniref:restriction endonuclease subunit S n=1 Tax=Lentisphaera marina TaxID=1111041 RepID=UPI0023671823|nr:restriction endonuclease subunit S [Lentisphaera marina]MDD7985077.1 restriction endonuclease subunit S [Lentisphaera marina]